MHQRETHNNMTKMFMPWIPMSTINEVNHRLDNPSRQDMMMARARDASFGSGPANPFMIPGMYYGGHRQYNHDMVTAMFAAFQSGGVYGMQAAMGHLIEDMMRTQLNGMLGPAGANMFEAAFNYAMTNKRYGHPFRVIR